MARRLTTTREVMEVLGGFHRVAAIVGAEPKAAENWKRQQTFPANTFFAMTRALARVGKNAPPELWDQRSGEVKSA